MSHPTIGELIEPTEPRDAIHIAIAPVIATSELAPGQYIGFTGEDTIHVCIVEPSMSVGIVDPFLKRNVKAGQSCWMFLHPNTITALRHEWTHPAFGNEPDMGPKKAEAERWLRYFLSNEGPDYDELIKAVNNGGEFHRKGSDDYYYVRIESDYLLVGGHDAHGEIPPEFWDHVETVVGRKLTDRPNHFSCSC